MNRRVLIDALNEVTVTRSTSRWVLDLEAVGVPAGRSIRWKPYSKILRCGPAACSWSCRIPHRAACALVASPLRLSGTPVTYRSAPPSLGAHTAEVLAQRLAMSASDIEALHGKGIV